MQDLLNTITNQYIDIIRNALLNAGTDGKLYGAFFGYYAWSAPSDELPDQSLELNILTEHRRKSNFENSNNNDVASYKSYCWAEFIGDNVINLESPELRQNLLEWYQYQQSDQFGLYNRDVLNQIGNAFTAACAKLNSLSWPSDKFTDDFVVFSECIGDDPNDYGIKQCVPKSWLDAKKEAAWFGNAFPIE